MTSTVKYTVRKGYQLFRGEATGTPMDEFSEQKLFGWLRARGGFSDKEAARLIDEIDQKGSASIEIDSSLP